MSRLNEDARLQLRDAGISQAEWARRNGYATGRWGGDKCGCPDDRCIGYHHDAEDECGCLRSLLGRRFGGLDLSGPAEPTGTDWIDSGSGAGWAPKPAIVPADTAGQPE